MATRVCLLTVAGGAVYERYAQQLGESAVRFFRPSPNAEFRVLAGREGWPAGTLYRYHIVRDHMDALADEAFTHVFLCDADMRFEATVGPEILPPGRGIVATLHPGYVTTPRNLLPYERRRACRAEVPPGEGERYFCGGFVGGSLSAFRRLCNRIIWRIDKDDRHGMTAVWHDESHLNRCLIDEPPAHVLSPAYCHPDRDEAYLGMWPEPYPRILVALDKPAEERQGR